MVVSLLVSNKYKRSAPNNRLQEKLDSSIPALHLEAETKGTIGDRIIRAVLYLSDGDLPKFHEKIKLARLDWRDVLMQAEYSFPEEERLRDFNKTFYELGLLKR